MEGAEFLHTAAGSTGGLGAGLIAVVRAISMLFIDFLVVLLPAVVGFLVDVAVFPGVHVAVAGLSDEAAAVLPAAAHDTAAFRRASTRDGAARIGIVSGLRPLVALCYNRTSPLAVSIGALPRSAGSSGVRIVGTCSACATVRIATARSTAVSSRRRVVPGTSRYSSIRTIGTARVTVCAIVWIVESAHAVGNRVGTIDGIRIAAVIVIRRVVVACTPTSHSQRRPRRHAAGRAPRSAYAGSASIMVMNTRRSGRRTGRGRRRCRPGDRGGHLGRPLGVADTGPRPGERHKRVSTFKTSYAEFSAEDMDVPEIASNFGSIFVVLHVRRLERLGAPPGPWSAPGREASPGPPRPRTR